MTTQTAAMRTTSLALSALLLGAAVITALTMSITMLPTDWGQDTPVIRTETLEPPAPPPPVIRDTRPPAPQEQDEPTVIAPPLNFADAEPIPTTDPVPSGPPAPETILRPHWLRTPTDLERFYPRRALQMGMQGEAVLDCRVSPAGALSCAVVRESPEGWGFGVAAQRIAAEYRMVPAMRGGVAVEGRYQMRVPFRVR